MNINKEDITIVILAGGKSERMDGQDKGLMRINKKYVIKHLYDICKEYSNEIYVNANRNIDIYNNNENLSRQGILKKYLKYALSFQNKNTSNYLLLRHLFSLYYNTSSSKKWKKFLHDIIQSDKDIELITNFEESTYDEEIKAYR